MASSKENPFSSEWFVFEEPPATNHRQRVHFPEPVRAKAAPPPNRLSSSPKTKAKQRPRRWITIDRLLQTVAIVLIVLIASTLKPLHADHVGKHVLQALRSYFLPSHTVNTTPLAIQREVQRYLEEHVEAHMEKFLEQYVHDTTEHLVQTVVEQHIEDHIELYIDRHVQLQLTRHMEHVEQVVRRRTRAILRQQVTGRRDYAFQADGGRIVSKLTSGEATKPRNGNDNRPDVILRDNLDGGYCWAVLGSRAQVGISVARLIHPSHITIDHVPAEVTEDFQQAPRHMRLWGSIDGQQNVDRYKVFLAQYPHHNAPSSSAPPITNNYHFVHLADFEYNVNSTSHIQTFPVFDYIPPLGMDFGVFVVEVLDNWGGSSTCLYRIRLHGYPSTKDE